MSESTRDQKLGMGRRITRRDFLDGVAVGIGALGLPKLPGFAKSPQTDASSRHSSEAVYPPALTGLRGSQPGAFEVAHALRDGTFWDAAGTPIHTSGLRS
ncbi:MAG TPA: twin-arginine translocation signal domain-containing protein [Candidatus Sulfotelmatobacter sp.]